MLSATIPKRQTSCVTAPIPAGSAQAPTAGASKVCRPAGSRGDTDLRVFGRTRHIGPLVDGDLAYAGDMLVYGTASLRLRSR